MARRERSLNSPNGRPPRPPRSPRPSGRAAGRSKPATKPAGNQPGQGLGERLQRVMADAGIASRRECEAMIEAGRVEVNGEAVTRLPVFVNPRLDRIMVDGRLLDPRAARGERVYVMLNKPERTLATTRDASAVEGDTRTTVVDLVDHPSGARLFPVGRLDYHSTGLILMTNDGDLTQRLTHARYGVTQTYRIWVGGKVTDEVLDMLRRRVGKREAVDETGAPTGGVRVDIRPGDKRPSGDISNSTVLELTLREGKRESVGDMLLACGCKVKKMVRVAIGPLRLRLVKVSEWRDLSADEVDALREVAGLIAPTSRRLDTGTRNRRGRSDGEAGGRGGRPGRGGGGGSKGKGGWENRKAGRGRERGR